MLADLIDRVVESNYQFALVHTEEKERKKLQKQTPKPYPRPGVEVEEEEEKRLGKITAKVNYAKVQQQFMDRL